ncbi:epidermal retinol dehydrogenase 2-like isoform X2 [Puntigrus tetrazona]|uniref:epidermal retinol dehydrogenase 2-like isoform X2 n=1 Tax=Puntigrus tetrazona TaxID=1606681 RepID=UPI001C89D9CB|nr:epidermal retinol dehydrogenase 2-like isoform X2 [Puntigrus tetrazona]
MHNQVIQSLEKVLHNLWFIKELSELILGAAFYFFEAFVRLFIPHCKKNVEGEIALVTGAANGIGKLIAKELGHHGATLVLWDINSDALDKTARELKQVLDVRVYAYTCDCSKRNEIYKVAELTYKAFLPAMLQQNHGHLVCVACHGGLFAMNGLADYCASKSAAVSFAESVALELLVLKKEGIKTTIVCPYLINTKMFRGCQTKRPSFLPILDQRHVAKQIVDAILQEKTYLLLPLSLHFLMALKSLMPAKLGIIFVNFIGGMDLMDHFRGVPVPIISYKSLSANEMTVSVIHRPPLSITTKNHQ